MHTFIRPRQFLNLEPADQQLDALTIRTLAAQGLNDSYQVAKLY